MKTIQKLLLAGFFVLAAVLLPGFGTVRAHAAGYTFVFVENEWRFMEGDYDTQKLTKAGTVAASEINKKVRDGDTVTFVGQGKSVTIQINADLEKLDIVGAATPIVTAKSVNEVAITAGSVAVVHGPVANAHLYGDAVATFYDDITCMYLHSDRNVAPTCNTNCLGTVSYLEKEESNGTVTTRYNFAKGKFSIEKGNILTDPSNYSNVGTKPSVESADNTAESAKDSKKKGSNDLSSLFDARYYAEKYSDLKAAFGTDEKKLYQHFITYGIHEGRRASLFFDPVYYKNTYPDLQKAFGDDWAAYYTHYLNFGKSEGRVTTQ